MLKFRSSFEKILFRNGKRFNTTSAASEKNDFMEIVIKFWKPFGAIGSILTAVGYTTIHLNILEGNMIKLDKRFDNLAESVDKRFDKLDESVNRRFDKFAESINKKFDQVNTKFDHQNLILQKILENSLDSKLETSYLKGRLDGHEDVRKRRPESCVGEDKDMNG